MNRLVVILGKSVIFLKGLTIFTYYIIFINFMNNSVIWRPAVNLICNMKPASGERRVLFDFKKSKLCLKAFQKTVALYFLGKPTWIFE